ncbi:hypothetical protein C8R43DRAFT_988047 [Mycena crocata]|nr:hypothetical protein C8R43DRAFT_988047 [Mycena crocata]
MLWRDTLEGHFAGVISVSEFFSTYLPPPPGADAVSSEGTIIDDLVRNSASSLVAAVGDVIAAQKEDDMSKRFIEHLEAIVSSFSAENKPSFEDTHRKRFPPIQSEDHYSSPDITATRPGKQVPTAWRWFFAGTVFELRYKTDIFNEHGGINASSDSEGALIQLAKSARSLLASGFCFVFVVAVFRKQARILRFDHASFRATHAFDWTTEERILPQFLWRLYNPHRQPNDTQARMYGEDDTIFNPTQPEKQAMYERWTKTSSYKTFLSEKSPASIPFDAATKDSRWVKAGRCDAEGNCVEVKCFTIGPPIYQSDGLFSRATRVDRVMLEDDDDDTVYALKDAWRQACRRPEADFYDLIHKYCEVNNVDPAEVAKMAKCHGTLELWAKSQFHKTDSTLAVNLGLERLHNRVLLTPVGSSLTKFRSSKELVAGLYAAVKHHSYAHAAGVLHRDISEGNIMFDELTREGFLVDWDYAEFTSVGLANFTEWFPERARAKTYQPIDKSLKELTGTFPFLAIEILKHQSPHTPPHTAAHDLESIYWLLIWIILRHTNHTHVGGRYTCHRLFDHDPETAAALKAAWIQEHTPLAQDLPLFELTDELRLRVAKQNPPVIKEAGGRRRQHFPAPQAPVPVPLSYADFLGAFHFVLVELGSDWPSNDKAITFVPPVVKAAAVPRGSKASAKRINVSHGFKCLFYSPSERNQGFRGFERM